MGNPDWPGFLLTVGISRAIFDLLQKGHDAKGLLTHGGFVFTAASYALLIPGRYGIRHRARPA